MCGIAGAFSSDPDRRPVTPEFLAAARDAMAHRGPDGEGLWLSPDRRVGLAHRRLSIIDLSPAAGQPMALEDGSLRIVFNGEIYNHAELRRDLEARGQRRWMTDHSDTEVILRAFREWGIDCLARFRGMFAFGLWDERRRELWLVRDRAGVKPLYTSSLNGRVAFASELRALLADRDLPRALDEDAFFHYLSYSAAPAPATLLGAVRKLPPASWLRVDAAGRTEERRYWDPLDAPAPPVRTEEETCEALRSLLRESVRLRKVSDVPVGVFLSGGVDSGANAILFSEGEARPVRTFSIGYAGSPGSTPDELPFARDLARRVGAEHHERVLSLDDLLDFLPVLARHQDEPLGDPVCFPVAAVSRLARDHGVVVCQLGEGADELFCGYPTWRAKRRLQRLVDRSPILARAAAAALGVLPSAGDDIRVEALRRAVRGLPLFWGGVDALTGARKHALLSPRLRKRFRGRSSWEVLEPIHRRFLEKARDRSPLQWMTYLDLNLRLPELLLMRVDKMAMAAGVEGRLPFLDHRMVELALAIPEELKTKSGVLKYILRKAMRGIVPDEVLDRPKQGFGVPVLEWYGDLRLRGRVEREVTRFADATDLLDPAETRRFLRERDGNAVWPLFSLALWWGGCVA